MPFLPRLLGLLFLCAMAAPSLAQTPDAPPVRDVSEEGYLLAGKLHQTPDPFSDEVQPVGRDERVRIVPAVGAPGWFAVYRIGETTPSGFAFRPYVSNLGSSDLAALQQPDGQAIPQRNPTQTPSDGAEGRLPSVVFVEGLTRADGVLTQVEQWANVRSGPGVGNEAFGVIRPFSPFRVVEIDRGWGKVLLQDEPGVGYVSGSLLHSVDEPDEAPIAETRPQPAQITGGAAGGRSTSGRAIVGVPVDGDPAAVGDEAVTEEEPGLEETTGIVYVTRTGKKYHRADCTHLRSMKFALPLAEAMLDFAPCRTCRPPTSVPADLPRLDSN